LARKPSISGRAAHFEDTSAESRPPEKTTRRFLRIRGVEVSSPRPPVVTDGGTVRAVITPSRRKDVTLDVSFRRVAEQLKVQEPSPHAVRRSGADLRPVPECRWHPNTNGVLAPREPLFGALLKAFPHWLAGSRSSFSETSLAIAVTSLPATRPGRRPVTPPNRWNVFAGRPSNARGTPILLEESR
jgi:hypothetical protein